MSNTRDDSLRPHLSALVDGELEPLEAIALTRHVRQSPALEADRQSLERLKFAVHLAGRQDPAPLGLETRLRAQVAGLAGAREVARARVGWRLPTLALMGTAALVALVAVVSLDGRAPLQGVPQDREAAALTSRVDLGESELEALVRVYRREESPMALRALREAGALDGEPDILPTGLLPAAPESTVVPVAYTRCNERETGSLIAKIRLDRVNLAPDIANALEGDGVYATRIDGVDVRISSSEDRLVVLIAPPLPFDGPI